MLEIEHPFHVVVTFSIKCVANAAQVHQLQCNIFIVTTVHQLLQETIADTL
jgi:hypothetical protein